MNEQHHTNVSNEINKRIDEMLMTYDTKLLATTLVFRGVQALRALIAANMWRKEDVKAVIDGATADVFLPFPKNKIPQISTIGISKKAS